MTVRVNGPVYSAGATVNAGRIVYESTNTLIQCDADSSQAATAALLPIGVALNSATSGQDLTTVVFGEAPVTAGTGGLTAGELFVCEDGAGGKVIAYDASDYSDGDPVYIVGRALEDIAADATGRALVYVQHVEISTPA